MSLRDQVEAHAAACRAAYMLDREWPQWAAGPLSGADLSNADLRRAFLRGADLSDANLSDANLRGADLFSADLSGATLTGVDLSGASLRWATLTGATLTGAHLSGADLTWTHLSDADLSGARLTEGVARGRAIGGESGGSRWWAVALVDGNVVLQCGCERRLLRWWLTEGPQFYSPEYWVRGPAVAIAAAVELRNSLRKTREDARFVGGET